jgi:cell division protein FtsB
MRYNEWNTLTDEEKKSTHWKHHPRIRVATIFSVLFALVFAVALLRIFKNKRVHVNRKPNRLEAFSVAKTFVQKQIEAAGYDKFPQQ